MLNMRWTTVIGQVWLRKVFEKFKRRTDRSRNVSWIVLQALAGILQSIQDAS